MKRPMLSFARLPRVVPMVGVVALLGSLAVSAQTITYELVPVGNPGNANDPATGGVYGAVPYDYQIGKYAVTIGQYTAFLNAVAATDTHSLYSEYMATNLNTAGISRAGSSGSYTYSVINNGGDSSNRPITFVSWLDSARFANWMANGQPTGAQSSTTTENGAYNLSGATSGDAPAKNVTNPNTGAAPAFYIPTENEWYKAAYYSPTKGGNGGYYTYATQSDTAPDNLVGSGANQANYFNGVYSVTQSSSYSPSQNYLTDVGAFTNSASFYGTFDQSGNVYEWNDLDGTSGLFRGLRGGDWGDVAAATSASVSGGRTETYLKWALEHIIYTGYSVRLASPAVVPEPSATCIALAGLACGGFSIWRRRKRA